MITLQMSSTSMEHSQHFFTVLGVQISLDDLKWIQNSCPFSDLFPLIPCNFCFAKILCFTLGQNLLYSYNLHTCICILDWQCRHVKLNLQLPLQEDFSSSEQFQAKNVHLIFFQIQQFWRCINRNELQILVMKLVYSTTFILLYFT